MNIYDVATPRINIIGVTVGYDVYRHWEGVTQTVYFSRFRRFEDIPLALQAEAMRAEWRAWWEWFGKE